MKNKTDEVKCCKNKDCKKVLPTGTSINIVKRVEISRLKK